MRPWCDRCGCARYRTRLNGLASGSLPLRPILLTRNTKSALPGGFRSLLQSGLSERLGLLFSLSFGIQQELGKVAIISPNHVLIRLLPSRQRMEFSEATAYSPNAALISPRGQRFRIALALR